MLGASCGKFQWQREGHSILPLRIWFPMSAPGTCIEGAVLWRSSFDAHGRDHQCERPPPALESCHFGLDLLSCLGGCKNAWRCNVQCFSKWKVRHGRLTCLGHWNTKWILKVFLCGVLQLSIKDTLTAPVMGAHMTFTLWGIGAIHSTNFWRETRNWQHCITMHSHPPSRNPQFKLNSPLTVTCSMLHSNCGSGREWEQSQMSSCVTMET